MRAEIRCGARSLCMYACYVSGSLQVIAGCPNAKVKRNSRKLEKILAIDLLGEYNHFCKMACFWSEVDWKQKRSMKLVANPNVRAAWHVLPRDTALWLVSWNKSAQWLLFIMMNQSQRVCVRVRRALSSYNGVSLWKKVNIFVQIRKQILRVVNRPSYEIQFGWRLTSSNPSCYIYSANWNGVRRKPSSVYIDTLRENRKRMQAEKPLNIQWYSYITPKYQHTIARCKKPEHLTFPSGICRVEL